MFLHLFVCSHGVPPPQDNTPSPWDQTPHLEPQKRAVRILLKCFLVIELDLHLQFLCQAFSIKWSSIFASYSPDSFPNRWFVK